MFNILVLVKKVLLEKKICYPTKGLSCLVWSLYNLKHAFKTYEYFNHVSFPHQSPFHTIHVLVKSTRERQIERRQGELCTKCVFIFPSSYKWQCAKHIRIGDCSKSILSGKIWNQLISSWWKAYMKREKLHVVCLETTFYYIFLLPYFGYFVKLSWNVLDHRCRSRK